MKQQMFYLTEIELCQAIGNYLIDYKGLDMDNGIIFFEKKDDKYEITVTEVEGEVKPQ